MATPPDLEAALRDLLWIAAWHAGDIRARTAPDLADRHEKLLGDITAMVLAGREDPALKAKRSRFRVADELLLHVHDGISSVFQEVSDTAELPALEQAQLEPAFIDRVSTWLEQRTQATHSPSIGPAAIRMVMSPSQPSGSIGEWVREQRGPVEAAATLLDSLDIIGRTRLLELRSVYRAAGWAEGVDLVGNAQRARYGGTGLTSDEVRRYAMVLLGFDPEVIDAALAAQPMAFEIDFVPGSWLP